MRRHFALAAAALAVGALALPSSAAGKAPVLDGSKTKELSFEAKGSMQFHDSENVTSLFSIVGAPLPQDPERVECSMPRCGTFDFVYQPAPGVTGDVFIKSTWTSPGSDIDLYLASIGKDGKPTEITHCATAGGTAENIFVAGKQMKAGTTYRVIVDFFRAADETATTKISFPSADGGKHTLPDEGFGILPSFNCGQ